MSPSPPASTRSSRWIPMAVAGGVFAVLLAWVHLPLFEGKVLAARDLFRLFIPDVTLLQQAFAEGTLPLWNPYQRLGQPFVATLYSQVLYPPRWLCALLFAPEVAVTVQHVLHVCILALGIHRACVRFGRSGVASFTAAVAVALSVFFLNLAPQQNITSAFAWTGFLIVAADELASRPNRRAVAKVGVFVGLSLLAGSPETTLWQALLAGTVVLFGHARGRGTLALAAGGVLGAVLAAGSLLPGLEWARDSDRVFSLHSALSWSGSPLNLLGFGWFLADQPTDVSGASVDQRFVLNTFVGAISGVLALVGFVSAVRVRRARPMAVGALGLGLLSLGQNFPPAAWVLGLPPFALFRYPVKYYVGFVFCLAVLAAFGVDELAAWRRRLERPKRAFLLSAVGIILFAAGCALYARWIGMPAWAAPGMAWSAAAVLVACALLLLGPDSLQDKGAWALAVAVIAETALVYALYPRSEWYDAAALQRQSAFLDVARSPNEARWSIDLLEDYETNNADGYVTSSRQMLIPLRWMEDQLEVAEGYGAPEPKRHQRVFEGPGRAFFDLVGVRWYVRRGEAPFEGLEERLRPDGFPALYESTTAFPRAFVTHRSTVMDDKAACFAVRGEGEVDLRSTVVLSEPSSVPSAECDGSTARVLHRGLHEVEVEVDACAPGHLVLTDAWDSGWRAKVNGLEAKVYRADYLVRAVEVPQGRSAVRFEYAPASFRLGAALSLLGLFAVGGLWWPVRRL